MKTDTLAELPDIVLKNKYLQFLEKEKCSLVFYSSMTDLEECLLCNIYLQTYTISRKYKSDIFLIWEHSEESLKYVLEKINNIHATIKSKTDWSKNSVSFLNLNVILNDGNIVTDLYVKPTDTYQYLDSSSCHPYHYRKSTPYSQALRLKRVCSNNAFNDQRCNKLECCLRGDSWLQEYSERIEEQKLSGVLKILRN